MLDLHRLHAQLSDFGRYRSEESRRETDRLRLALEAFTTCCAAWSDWNERAEAAHRQRRWRSLTAGLTEPPDACAAESAPPRPLTVVATDGSQIFPDRHAEPACYLLNVSRVAFHYGTDEPPLLRAEPDLRFRQRDLDLLAIQDGEAMFDVTAEVVSALRDEQELEWLLHTAREHRRPARPILAVADGTLIRWMLRGMKNRTLEDTLLARYLGLLEGFREDGIPVCSFVSKPGNTELVNLLRFVRGEEEEGPEEASIRGLHDRHLFEAVLEVGERSALFRSGSRIQAAYGPAQEIHYVYVRLPEEVARIEMPRWVAEQPGWLDLLHGALLDECRKGGGYPMILTEAHERAVVRAEERRLFFGILERTLRAAGLSEATTSRKALSKRIPRI